MPQNPPLSASERGLSLPTVGDGAWKNVEVADGAAPHGVDEDELEGGGGSATLFSCVLNLANTIVGAGMLGLPGAFGGTGYVGGPLLIVVGAAFSAHGLTLLSRSATMVGVYPSSFYTVAHAAVPKYTVLIDLAVALKCFGVATGYLITVADCMVDALDHILLPEGGTPHSPIVALLLSRRFWVAGAAVGVLPVSFYREFDKLKHSSAAALVFVFMLAAGIVAYANGLAGDPCEGYDDESQPQPCVGEIVPFTDLPTTVSKLPIFIFAFTCQQNIFPIVNEIHHRTARRLNVVVISAIGFALAVFLVVALEGYLTYGSSVKGDILLNYPEDAKVTFMRVCIAFMLMLHYPLQLDPSRRCILSLLGVMGEWAREWRTRRRYGRGGFFGWMRGRGGSFVDEEEDDGRAAKLQAGYTEFSKISSSSARPKDYSGMAATEEGWTDDVVPSAEAPAKETDGKNSESSDALFLIVTISFLLSSFGIALAVDDLGIVLALVGATGSTLVSYVLPGLIYIKVQKDFCAKKVTAYVQLIAGCLVMPTALYFVFKGGGGE